MPVYISLLRGINVGGSKVILMPDLKKVFENSGFSEVKTYIQSGNVVFQSEKKHPQELAGVIKGAIKSRFKFDVGVMVLVLDELEKMLEDNPFGEVRLKTGERIYLTVLSGKPAKEKVNELSKMKNGTDDVEIIDQTVYVVCRKGYAKSQFNNNAIEKVLCVNATTRNLETMKKLVEIGKNI